KETRREKIDHVLHKTITRGYDSGSSVASLRTMITMAGTGDHFDRNPQSIHHAVNIVPEI
ncbi:MAG: hypothetical protein KJ589_10295, partial [Proteobacteria bacterium]|nr:hypothetical protein [Pseudomonadota bacterium]